MNRLCRMTERELAEEFARIMEDLEARGESVGDDDVVDERCMPLVDHDNSGDKLTFMLQPTTQLVEYENTNYDTDPRPDMYEGPWSSSDRWIGAGCRLRRTAMNGGHGKPILTLASMLTKVGNYYSLEARMLGPRMMFTVGCVRQFDSAVLYDGEDFDRAFEMYCELTIALKGVAYAEEFAKTKATLLKNLDKLQDKPVDMTLKYAPLFLGDADLPFC